MNFSPTRLKIVPFAVAVLLANAATSSLAAPVVGVGYGDLSTGLITLGAEYAMPKNGTVVDAMRSGEAQIYDSGANADMYLYKNGPDSSNVFFHTYGSTGSSTYFGARASGEGNFYANTFARYSQTFTNAGTQAYSFSFDVDNGELAMTGAGAGFAELMLRVNITSISSGVTQTVALDHTKLSQATAQNETPVQVCQDLGSSGVFASYLGCSADGSSVVGGSSSHYDLDLGLITGSFTLDYDIIAIVAGDLSASQGYGSSTSFNAYGCEVPPQEVNAQAVFVDDGGQEEGVCEVFSYSFPGMAIARSGDPFNGPDFGNQTVSGNQFAPFQLTSSPANGVPEPGSLALLGLGLAGLVAMRRKKA